MKKFLVCVTTIVCLFPVISVFAQENSNDAFFKAEALIQEGLFENTEELKELSADLSVAETEQLYSINKKDATIPFCVNFFGGYGIGSFLQGDKKTGVTALIGCLAGQALSYSGYLVANSVITEYEAAIAEGTADSFDWSQKVTPVLVGGGMMLCGVIADLSFTIYSSIKSLNYAKEYNTTLKDSLVKNNDEEKVSVQFAPVIDISSNKYGMLASVRF